MKEEEKLIEKGDCGPPTRKVFFSFPFFFSFIFVGLEPSGTLSPRRRESNALADTPPDHPQKSMADDAPSPTLSQSSTGSKFV